MFETGKPILNVEMRGVTLRKPDAVQKWLGSFYPLSAEDGTVSAVSIMAVDITGPKQNEGALKPSQARNPRLVEKPNQRITPGKTEGAFLDGNSALLSIR